MGASSGPEPTEPPRESENRAAFDALRPGVDANGNPIEECAIDTLESEVIDREVVNQAIAGASRVPTTTLYVRRPTCLLFGTIAFWQKLN
jgi:hypothetical protein